VGALAGRIDNRQEITGMLFAIDMTCDVADGVYNGPGIITQNPPGMIISNSGAGPGPNMITTYPTTADITVANETAIPTTTMAAVSLAQPIIGLEVSVEVIITGPLDGVFWNIGVVRYYGTSVLPTPTPPPTGPQPSPYPPLCN
jgi:hypothetical protein